MSANKKQCQGRVPVYGLNFPRYRQCKHTAKVERNGVSYCAAHDPEAKKAKREEREARWKADLARSSEAALRKGGGSMSYDTNDAPAEHDCAAMEEELANAKADLEAAKRFREDRTRALAARVDALTRERDTARASADRWHGVAHQMEVERDAAVKAKDSAEGARTRALDKYDAVSEHNVQLMRNVASLRAQLSEAETRLLGMTGERDDERLISQEWELKCGDLEDQLAEAREREGRYREALEGVEQSASWTEALAAVRILRDLSPSPASGVEREEAPKPRLVAAMVCPHTTEFVCSRCAAPGKDGATR